MGKRWLISSLVAVSVAVLFGQDQRVLHSGIAQRRLAAGWNHSLAVKDGVVWSWGDNTYGQLGQPRAGASLTPCRVKGLERVVAVSAAWHSLAVTAEGTVYGWGRNDLGQLGNGRCGLGAQEEVPVRIKGLDNVVAVAAGWFHSLALTRDGRVYAWGCRSHGQLGDGVRVTGEPLTRPLELKTMNGIVMISAGSQHSLALRRDGTLLAWGSNWNGQLGNGELGRKSHAAVPAPVRSVDGKGELQGIVAMAAGALHSVAMDQAGVVYTWGHNGTGQMGDGKRGNFWGTEGRLNFPLPAPAFSLGVRTDGSSNDSQVAAGSEGSYVVGSDHLVYCAGWGMYGAQASGGGGSNARLAPARTVREVYWQNPRKGTWRLSLAYKYTDLSHVDKGIKDLPLLDSFSGPPVVIDGGGEGGGLATGTVQRRENQVEAQASLAYSPAGATGEPMCFMLNHLFFGSHSGDNDYATDVSLHLSNAASGEVVKLPLSQASERLASGIGLSALSNIVEVASGAHHVLARDREGALWAWGHNGFGQVGVGRGEDVTTAQKVSPFDYRTKAMARTRPVKPARDFTPPAEKHINALKNGVKGDGIALDQQALQGLIDRCSKDEGGGVIWLPPGNYLTGTLFMRSGVRLHLSAGATILASVNRDHFTGKALVQGENVGDVALTGAGTLDARGWFVGARDWRHYCVFFENCRNVRLEGIRTLNSGSWTQHYISCVGLTLRNLYVRSLLPGRNNDGIDLSGCQNVRIEGCTVISDDDALVIKTQRVERENRDIELLNNVCHTYRGALKLGTETRGLCSNIVCRGLTCYGSKAVELYSVDGSQVDGIAIEDVKAYDALTAINIRLGARLRPGYWAKGVKPEVGFLRNIHIRNMAGNTATRAWRDILREHDIEDAAWANGRAERCYDSCISGLPGHLVENVLLENIAVKVPGGGREIRPVEQVPENPTIYPHAGNFGELPAYGLFARHVSNLELRDVRFKPKEADARPEFVFVDTPGLKKHTH